MYLQFYQMETQQYAKFCLHVTPPKPVFLYYARYAKKYDCSFHSLSRHWFILNDFKTVLQNSGEIY